MQAPRNDLVRALRSAPDFTERDSNQGSGARLEGHVITWGDWYEIDSVYEGRFLETIAPGAATKTIDENRNGIKVTFNHGHDPQLGDKVLGTLDELSEDDLGVFFRVGLFDTQYNGELMPGFRSGVYGSSHRFRVINEKWVDEPARSEHNPDGIPERTITEIGLHELGPVTFPANPNATAGVRSIGLTDEWRSHHGLAVPAGTEDPATPPDVEPATESTEPEPQAHSDGLTPGQRESALRRINLKE